MNISLDLIAEVFKGRFNTCHVKNNRVIKFESIPQRDIDTHHPKFRLNYIQTFDSFKNIIW